MVRSNLSGLGCILVLSLGLPTCWAALTPSFGVELPADSPVLIVSTAVGGNATAQSASDGGVHANLSLRNVSAKAIAGLTFRILSEAGDSAGQASMLLPSVQAEPGAVFPIRVDVALPRRYAVRTPAAGIRLALDGVLFRDLSFYGPDALHSRRSLTVYECEARREQSYLQSLLAAGHLSEIREELNFGLPEEQPQFRLELLPFQIPEDQGKTLSVKPIVFAQAPLEIVGGGALLTETAVIDPHVLVKNQSTKSVRSLEIGFVLRDERGREAQIATLPAQLTFEPTQTRVLQQRATMVLSRVKGQPIVVRSLAAFVANAEFDDGSMWIPSRQDIDHATDNVVLRRVLADCPETERMSGIFRHTGISGVESELKAGR